jgi:hypothetical protein
MTGSYLSVQNAKAMTGDIFGKKTKTTVYKAQKNSK